MPFCIGDNGADRLIEGFMHATGPKTRTEAVRMALDAVKRCGKIMRHEADLGFGESFAYGCASPYGARLVSKGNDLARTDGAWAKEAL